MTSGTWQIGADGAERDMAWHRPRPAPVNLWGHAPMADTEIRSRFVSVYSILNFRQQARAGRVCTFARRGGRRGFKRLADIASADDPKKIGPTCRKAGRPGNWWKRGEGRCPLAAAVTFSTYASVKPRCVVLYPSDTYKVSTHAPMKVRRVEPTRMATRSWFQPTHP